MVMHVAIVYKFFKKKLFIYLFIYLWLCWVFVSVRGVSLVAASGGHSSSRCLGLSLSRPLLLRSTGSRRAGSAIVAHGPSCSAACGIFSDQGSNPCPLHRQADSQPLRHQGSPVYKFWCIIFHCRKRPHFMHPCIHGHSDCFSILLLQMLLWTSSHRSWCICATIFLRVHASVSVKIRLGYTSSLLPYLPHPSHPWLLTHPGLKRSCIGNVLTACCSLGFEAV